MTEMLIVELIKGGFMLAQAGLNRDIVVAKVNEKLDAGATDQEIADMLRDGRLQSEIEAQQAINDAGGQSST